MASVSSADQLPGGASTGTVEEPTIATRSCNPSTDSQPEITRRQKPEVARQPVIMQQPTALAPYSQIQAGLWRNSVSTLISTRVGTDNRSTAAAYLPFHTGTGNPYDVIQASVEVGPTPDSAIILPSVEH